MNFKKIISCLIILIGIITMTSGCGANNDDNVNSDTNESTKLLVKETSYDELDKKISEVIHLYDSNGSKEEKTSTIYYINDVKAITTSFHTYSDDGNRETTASKGINVSGVESYSRTDYEYDSSGNLILQSYSSSSGDGSYNEQLDEFEYYPNGIKKTHTLTLGSYTITTEFNLNEPGDRIESSISNWNSPDKGINFNLKTEYLYNSDSRNTEQITYAPDGSIESKTEFAYDSDGDIIEEINYSSDDSGKTFIINNKIVYEYVTVEEWRNNYSEYKKEVDAIASNQDSNNSIMNNPIDKMMEKQNQSIKESDPVFEGVLKVDGSSCWLKLDVPICHTEGDGLTIESDQIFLPSGWQKTYKEYSGMRVSLKGGIFAYKGASLMFEWDPIVMSAVGEKETASKTYKNWDSSNDEKKFGDAIAVIQDVLYQNDSIWDVRILCDGDVLDMVDFSNTNFYPVMLQINQEWITEEYDYTMEITACKDYVCVSFGTVGPDTPCWEYSWDGSPLFDGKSLTDYMRELKVIK